MNVSKQNTKLKNEILTSIAQDYIRISNIRSQKRSERYTLIMSDDQKFKLDELVLLIKTNLRNRNISHDRITIRGIIDFIVAKFFEDNQIDFEELFKDNIDIIITK